MRWSRIGGSTAPSFLAPKSYNSTKRRYLEAGLCIQCGLVEPMKNRKWCKKCLLRSNHNGRK